MADVPAVLILVGIAAYAVLAGADFGAGFWQLSPGSGERQRAIRAHAYHAMGPVWEANHVWLIFVLVVCWTAYPSAFGSIASTLAVPLFVAAVGIILRGTTYALRANTETRRGQRRVELVFALSSILTPFALGAVVGGIASGRVPVGNARGDLVTSWLNATSIIIGILAVATGAYLAAAYLAADAVRLDAAELVRAFQRRALAAGVLAGAIALAGLGVLRSDAEPIWHGLTGGWGLVALIGSGAGGVSTLLLVRAGRFGPARVTAALAVSAIIAGWGVAQRPQILPGLTLQEAAAPHATLVALLVGVGIGALLLLPSLALLFALFLGGRFDVHRAPLRVLVDRAPEARKVHRPALAATATIAGVAGVGFTTFSDAAWAHAVGVLALFVFLASAFLLITIPGEADRA